MEVEIWQSKQRAPVQFVTRGGEVIRGSVFLAQKERVLDLVNGNRAFVPFESLDGEFQAINKSNVDRLALVEDGEPAKVSSALPRAAVEIATISGEVFRGHFFIAANTRIIDVANGERHFIPFETDQGHFEIINKTAIARLTPIE